MGKQVAAGLNGGLAQLGEHLPCKQGVESSNLLVSSSVNDEKVVRTTCTPEAEASPAASGTRVASTPHSQICDLLTACRHAIQMQINLKIQAGLIFNSFDLCVVP